MFWSFSDPLPSLFWLSSVLNGFKNCHFLTWNNELRRISHAFSQIYIPIYDEYLWGISANVINHFGLFITHYLTNSSLLLLNCGLGIPPHYYHVKRKRKRVSSPFFMHNILSTNGVYGNKSPLESDHSCSSTVGILPSATTPPPHYHHVKRERKRDSIFKPI